MKQLFIESYVWMFGCSKKVAADMYKKHLKANSTGYIEAVIDCYKSNANRCFYDD